MPFILEPLGDPPSQYGRHKFSAHLYTKNKPPELLSNWIVTAYNIDKKGQPKDHFNYTLSGPLYREDYDALEAFGEKKGQEVKLTLINLRLPDMPIYDCL